MTRNDFLTMAEMYVENSPFNNIGPHTRDAEGYYGLHIFDKPIMAVGRADDPMWKELWRPEVVGQHFTLPTEWLPGAKTVISFFFPACQIIKDETAKEVRRVPKEWLFARCDAQWVMFSFIGLVAEKLQQAGYQTCVPSDDPRLTFSGNNGSHVLGGNGASIYGGKLSNFEAYGIPQKYEEYIQQPYYKRMYEVPFPNLRSNWSERHVAYVCGLGTFGLSTNLITKSGSSGRFISIVTDWEADEYDVRPYSHYMEYCIHCGACIKCCPAGAITKDGKDMGCCHTYFTNEIIRGFDYIPRYGCGKCQTSMPCDGGIPGKASRAK